MKRLWFFVIVIDKGFQFRTVIRGVRIRRVGDNNIKLILKNFHKGQAVQRFGLEESALSISVGSVFLNGFFDLRDYGHFPLLKERLFFNPEQFLLILEFIPFNHGIKSFFNADE